MHQKQKEYQLHGEIRLLSGNANEPIAQAIAKRLRVDLVDSKISKFADGETRVEIYEDIRGTDVFIIQPTCPPANDNLMELLIMIDACRRASADRITAVIPYFGYARQDRKANPRAPITAKLVANMFTAAGVDRVVTMDLHATQIQGFFDIPLDDLRAAPTLIEDIRKKFDLEEVMIVSPDVGGVARARSVARRLDVPLAVVDKRRDTPNQASVMNLIGDVTDKTCIVIDDIIDTAGTMVSVADALLEKGAKSVCAYASHGIFSGPAVERIEKSNFTEVVVTNSVYIPKTAWDSPKIRVVSMSSHLAEAIYRIATEQSIAALYEENPTSLLDKPRAIA